MKDNKATYSPDATFESAEKAQLRVRRLSQLSLLAGFGMLGIITLLVAYTYVIHSRSRDVESRLLNCRIAMQRALVGINLDATSKLADISDTESAEYDAHWLNDLKRAASELSELAEDPLLYRYRDQLRISTKELSDWQSKSTTWQEKQRVAKLAADKSLGQINELLSELRLDVEREKGKERLDAVLAFRRSVANSGDKEQLVESANTAIRVSSSSHSAGDIANVQLGIQQLSAELDLARLADKVQNEVRPRLLRLESSVAIGGPRELVQRIKDHLFQQVGEPVSAASDGNGYIPLQEELAHLRQEKRELLKQVHSCISFLNSEQEQIDQISLELSDVLGRRFVFAVAIVWTIICLCAIVLSTIFWRLGKRVSMHIRNQVNQLNVAANALHQEKVVLTVTQQRLERELHNHKVTQCEREDLFSELAAASRQAGMAEMATSVLHNVGNVLNSVNVSAHVVADKLKLRHADSLKKACQLIETHRSDLGQFFHEDERGRKLPEFLNRLADAMSKENEEAIKELTCLEGHVEHIKQIVNTQQSFAKVTNLKEPLFLDRLMEDALKINESGLTRHEVRVIREYEELPQILTDRNKVLQIVVNLIKNAKQSVCQRDDAEDRWVRLKIHIIDGQSVHVQVSDNGVGIAKEHMPRMFTHGFTTKKDGHGFGLHSSAITAKELGGELSVRSEGVSKGASFILRLPLVTLNSSCMAEEEEDVHEITNENREQIAT